jgi:uncharacterized protein
MQGYACSRVNDGRNTMASVATIEHIVDADTHLSEPPDLWTARIPARFRDDAPQVKLDESSGLYKWRIGDRWCSRVGNYSVAGWPEPYPACPPSMEEADPACYDAKARLAHMDRLGIYAQVLYPNIIAFEGHAFMALKDDALKLACVQTWNDYQAEFASPDPARFVTLAMLPFWDLDASVKELRRCHEIGHRGMLWASTLDRHGLPDFTDDHWDPVYAVAEELGMSVNFHVGVGSTEEEINEAMRAAGSSDERWQSLRTALNWLSNARTIGKLITSDVVDKFPTLNFVSVESGFGYVPFLIEGVDWQWLGNGGPTAFPKRLMPSEYFLRQVYTMFWFEKDALALLPKYQDNVMFETDFPHPTALHPGPALNAVNPVDIMQRDLDLVGADIMRKVLHDNAARVYHVT